MGCGIYATREYYHLIFPQKFSPGDYSFFYASGDNNVVGLIQLITYNAYTLGGCVLDDYLVYTMGNDIMETMELKNGNIYDDYDYICGGEHEMDNDT